MRYNRLLMSRKFCTSDKIAKVARVSLSLLCLCLFAMALGGYLLAAAQVTSGEASRFSPRFAIADFDGDRKPDVATVEVVREAALGSFYSIRLQLSAGEESVIGITGPQGGLELVARDVNGDDVIDLVVTTAMGSHFVAVLINDGHGKFALAKPGAFPSVENDERMHLVAVHGPAEECAALQLTRGAFGIESLRDAGTGPARKLKFSPVTICNAGLADVRRGRSGRSPPVAVSHS